ncbi:MAG: adenylate/guanylate cyclase domain-containing protein [Blastocatellia bacterium]
MTENKSNNLVGYFQELPLFTSVPVDLLEKIHPEMMRHYGDGDLLFQRGEAPRHLVILLEGQVCISVDNIFLVCRQAPTVLGEQAFIDGTDHSADIIAQGFVKALVLPQAVVQELMKNNTFANNLLRIVSCKLREATDERAKHYRREKLLFSEFRAHLSDEVVSQLLATGKDYGEPRYINDAVILFADIRSFSDRSANMSPAAIASQLSQYLETMVDIIHRHDGLVDKFIGDAVMAVWRFVPNDDKVAQAFACAQSMVRHAAELHFGNEPIEIGIGLNRGQVFLGNVGGENKRQFTVLGRPVNLAARFESKAKDLRVPIVAGQAFFDLLPPDLQSHFRVHPNQDIKGDERQKLFTFDPLLSH